MKNISYFQFFKLQTLFLSLDWRGYAGLVMEKHARLAASSSSCPETWVQMAVVLFQALTPLIRRFSTASAALLLLSLLSSPLCAIDASIRSLKWKEEISSRRDAHYEGANKKHPDFVLSRWQFYLVWALWMCTDAEMVNDFLLSSLSEYPVQFNAKR